MDFHRYPPTLPVATFDVICIRFSLNLFLYCSLKKLSTKHNLENLKRKYSQGGFFKEILKRKYSTTTIGSTNSAQLAYIPTICLFVHPGETLGSSQSAKNYFQTKEHLLTFNGCHVKLGDLMLAL
ncbi:hypothetical protein RHGRI_028842 [Rhododendron griersonianum]|uniref:Peptidylprolyl isomerase n=1 Tax=Rhododendron griersonianum TaxID=479676 RepID=A0AAV6IJ80_9ERIC|nr:hypothetical protein RHGRI_028842 [Rhododendron griersonianum]